MKKTVKEKVLHILELAMESNNTLSSQICVKGKTGLIYIKIRNGYICQSVFCDPKIVGSTCGKRRLRELRTELSDKYIFEMRRKNDRVEYRIRPRIKDGAQLVCL